MVRSIASEKQNCKVAVFWSCFSSNSCQNKTKIDHLLSQIQLLNDGNAIWTLGIGSKQFQAVFYCEMSKCAKYDPRWYYQQLHCIVI